MFPIKQLNKKGIYAVNLFTLGVPHTIFVDDMIPTKPISADDMAIMKGPFSTKKLEQKFYPAFAKGAPNNSLWPILAEKAFAKSWGSYKAIKGGFGFQAMS